jgi:DnaJ family protein A protein 5
VRKRDPRYKAHIAQQQNTAANASVPPHSTAALRRGEVATTYVDQEWQKLDRPTTDPDLEWAVAEDDELEEWECVACGKSFRSEAAWDSHERSKKHMKEVERLKREMGVEDDELGLAENVRDLDLDESTVSQPPPVAESAETTDGRVDEIPQPVPLTKSEKKMRHLLDGHPKTSPASTFEPSAPSNVCKESKRDKRKDREAKKTEGETSIVSHVSSLV